MLPALLFLVSGIQNLRIFLHIVFLSTRKHHIVFLSTRKHLSSIFMSVFLSQHVIQRLIFFLFQGILENFSLWLVLTHFSCINLVALCFILFGFYSCFYMIYSFIYILRAEGDILCKLECMRGC